MAIESFMEEQQQSAIDDFESQQKSTDEEKDLEVKDIKIQLPDKLV